MVRKAFRQTVSDFVSILHFGRRKLKFVPNYTLNYIKSDKNIECVHLCAYHKFFRSNTSHLVTVLFSKRKIRHFYRKTYIVTHLAIYDVVQMTTFKIETHGYVQGDNHLCENH